jgi:Zn-dependent protease with chaperone function
MPIQITCACGKTAEVPDHFAGRTGRCNKCGQPVSVPAAAMDSAPVLPEAAPSPPLETAPPAETVSEKLLPPLAPPLGTEAQSLARRALFAVALTIGFYLLAIVIAALLLFIPYAEWNYAGRLHIKLAFCCVLAGGVILWSIVPRRDRFTPPGPLLLPREQPELFSVLRSVARDMGQEMPAEVYALGEMNAWVMDRGGFLGYGSKRVMGLGLPLLQVLNVSQAKGVSAHEFGHFYGGDTKLGPWIYRTRSAMMRTLEMLGDDSLVQKPFVWYGNAFMRITQTISRGQEFTADRMAAAIVGTAAMVAGLRVIHGGGPFFDAFWRNEYAPALEKGFRPPLADGFARFLQVPKISAAVTEVVQEQLAAGETSIYDSHPSLRDRVAALERVHVEMKEQTAPALSLLRQVDKLEEALLSRIAVENGGEQFLPIHWEQVGARVWVPLWEEQLAEHRDLLQELRLQALAEILPDREAKSRLTKGLPMSSEEETDGFLTWIVGAAITVQLARKGWHPDATPGNEIALRKDGIDLLPFVSIRELLAGKEGDESWERILAEVGGETRLAAA